MHLLILESTDQGIRPYAMYVRHFPEHLTEKMLNNIDTKRFMLSTLTTPEVRVPWRRVNFPTLMAALGNTVSLFRKDSAERIRSRIGHTWNVIA